MVDNWWHGFHWCLTWVVSVCCNSRWQGSNIFDQCVFESMFTVYNLFGNFMKQQYLNWCLKHFIWEVKYCKSEVYIDVGIEREIYQTVMSAKYRRSNVKKILTQIRLVFHPSLIITLEHQTFSHVHTTFIIRHFLKITEKSPK